MIVKLHRFCIQLFIFIVFGHIIHVQWECTLNALQLATLNPNVKVWIQALSFCLLLLFQWVHQMIKPFPPSPFETLFICITPISSFLTEIHYMCALYFVRNYEIYINIFVGYEFLKRGGFTINGAKATRKTSIKTNN